MLELELQRGNVPDVVIFYDGVNDVFSTFQNGASGLPQNEASRVEEFGSRNRVNLRGLTDQAPGCGEREQPGVNDAGYRRLREIFVDPAFTTDVGGVAEAQTRPS